MSKQLKAVMAVSTIGLFTLGAVIPAPAHAAVTLCNGLTATIVGTAGNDTNLTGTTGSDVIAGLGGNDVIKGLDGNDTICPGQGNDQVDGGPGNDTLVAEATVDGADEFVGDTPGPSQGGSDTVSYAARSVAVSVDLNEIADDGQAGEGDLIDANTVDVVEGGSGNDTIKATFQELFRLVGGPGKDTLTGGAFLSGGPGDDTMTFPAGSPSGNMFGGDGDDTMTGVGGGGVFFSGGAGKDRITAGTANEQLDGDEGDDTLIGGTGNNFLGGGDGNDDLTGGLGNDLISGDDGNDTYRASVILDGQDFISGGAGSDTASYQARNNAGRGTILSLDLDGGVDDGEPGEKDSISTDMENLKGGTGTNIISGNSAANLLEGNQNADLIFGADGISGNDVIISHNFGNDACTFDPGDQVAC